MTQELTKNLKAVFLKNGVIIWKESDRLDMLSEKLINQGVHNFIKLDGNLINSAEVAGIFDAQTMHEWTRRKNGEWQCDKNGWHARGEPCRCLSSARKEYIRKKRDAIEACEKCDTFGMKMIKGKAVNCECWLKIKKPPTVDNEE